MLRIVADATPCRNWYDDDRGTDTYQSGDENQSTRPSNHFSHIFTKGDKTMNTLNTQAKAAKKLTINKETIRQLSSTQIMTGTFGPTAECTFQCTFTC
jgi:hypothetical protein